jgi:hypothetical protein
MNCTVIGPNTREMERRVHACHVSVMSLGACSRFARTMDYCCWWKQVNCWTTCPLMPHQLWCASSACTAPSRAYRPWPQMQTSLCLRLVHPGSYADSLSYFPVFQAWAYFMSPVCLNICWLEYSVIWTWSQRKAVCVVVILFWLVFERYSPPSDGSHGVIAHKNTTRIFTITNTEKLVFVLCLILLPCPQLLYNTFLKLNKWNHNKSISM